MIYLAWPSRIQTLRSRRCKRLRAPPHRTGPWAGRKVLCLQSLPNAKTKSMAGLRYSLSKIANQWDPSRLFAWPCKAIIVRSSAALGALISLPSTALSPRMRARPCVARPRAKPLPYAGRGPADCGIVCSTRRLISPQPNPVPAAPPSCGWVQTAPSSFHASFLRDGVPSFHDRGTHRIPSNNPRSRGGRRRNRLASPREQPASLSSKCSSRQP
jgi:hypothetical protein